MDRSVTVQLMECRVPFSIDVRDRLLGSFEKDRVRVVIDRRSVNGPTHLSSAFMHAARAIISERSRARDPSMEVLRWLTGSHQLVEGQKKGSPGPDTRYVLVCTAPEGWPLDQDAQGPPEIKEVFGDVEGSYGLVPVESGKEAHFWGGRSASILLEGGFQGTDLELEMAILELVAFTDLV